MTIEEIVERALDESLDDVPDDGTLIRLGADAVRIAAQCRSAARDACLAVAKAILSLPLEEIKALKGDR